MASAEGKTVCVTGGSGYVASWLIKLLLERGYTVRATVRNLNDEKKFKHLLELEGAKERLQLFKADLLEESSFDSAIDGCVGVFHTASPCYLDCKDPQAELIEPAVKGTINVLTSCSKSSSLRRVIFTSTAGTIIFPRTPPNSDSVADETWFSDPELCREQKMWYMLSKTLAEEEAWKFAKAKGIDMVTINPGMIIGPLLQPKLNFSNGLIASLVNNETNTYPNASCPWVHVKDVAQGHILAFENPLASGRYAVIESRVHFSEVLSIIHKLYPDLPLPNHDKGGYFLIMRLEIRSPIHASYSSLSGIEVPLEASSYQCVDETFSEGMSVSNEKAKSLGVDSYIPLKVSLKETIESLREYKLIAF